MFGIGLPELILIMAVALIVVGPEKLPDLARGLAKQFFELKKAANVLKDSLSEEEILSNKTAVNPDASVGLSRPEQFAAAAMAGQGRQDMEPGSPRPEVLDLVDAAAKPELADAAQQEPETPVEDVAGAEEPGIPAPPVTGAKPGKADV